LGIAFVRALQRHGDHGAAVHIDRMFGLVRQVGRTVFHLRNPRIRVKRVFPILVRAFTLALLIQSRQVGARRRVDPGGLCSRVKNSS